MNERRVSRDFKSRRGVTDKNSLYRSGLEDGRPRATGLDNTGWC